MMKIAMVSRRVSSSFVIGALASAAPVWASGDFRSAGTCGSATVVSGDTCSNVKVQFDFQGCDLESEPQVAKRVICDKKTIKARFQEGDLRYEAHFEKMDDGWGGLSWKPLGGVAQFKKRNSSRVAEPRLEVYPAKRLPAEDAKLVASLAAPAPNAEPTPAESKVASRFRFGGFADLRFSNFSTKENPLVSSGNPESGFGLEDGAFYGGFDKENISVVLDLAFRRSKDIDVNSSASKPNQSSNGNFALGYDKSQLFLKYKLGSNLIINFGQFDTIFGVELNDSKDRIFGKTGIVYDNTLPVTHTGLMAELLSHGFYSKVFSANPNNKGSYGSSSAGDDKAEYGIALGFSNDYFRTQAGYMRRPINKASGTASADRTLLDVILGTTLGSFSVDLEYSRISDPSKNTLTSSDSSDLEDAGQGMMALLSYRLTENFLLGARYESLRDDPAALSVKSVQSYGGSAHYKLSSELTLRTEYIAYESKNVSDTSWRDSRFNVAAVLVF